MNRTENEVLIDDREKQYHEGKPRHSPDEEGRGPNRGSQPLDAEHGRLEPSTREIWEKDATRETNAPTGSGGDDGGIGDGGSSGSWRETAFSSVQCGNPVKGRSRVSSRGSCVLEGQAARKS